MKRVLMLVICCLVVPGAAHSGQSLYDITAATVSITQKFNYCITGQACSQDDYLALKDEAGNALRDTVQLVKNGGPGAMKFTPGQAGDLFSAIKTMKTELISVQSSGQQACGVAFQMIIMAWLSFVSAFVSLFSPETAQSVLSSGGPAAGIALYVAQSLPSAMYALAVGIVFALLGIILYPACLL
jgi:hypothetical protein